MYLVIGHPIAHSLSPILHSAVYRECNIQAEYQREDCREDDLPALIERLRTGAVQGVNVTLPLKEKIIPFLDKTTAAADRIGAVNCVSTETGKLVGHNTDSVGFLRVLQRHGLNPDGMDCAILGAGGSARAVTDALKQSEVRSVLVINRTRERADALIKDFLRESGKTIFKAGTPADVDIEKPILWINCTAVGMGATLKDSPLPEKYIKRHHIVFDLVYNPPATGLLLSASTIGAGIIGGMELLVEQGLASIRIWHPEANLNLVNVPALLTLLRGKA